MKMTKKVSYKDLAKLSAGIATGETAIGIIFGHPELGLMAMPFGAMALGDWIGGLSKKDIINVIKNRKIKLKKVI